MFPKSIHAACDCTLYETTRKFEGCGSVTHKRKVKARGRRKNGELKEVKVTLYGWKVWAVYEIKTGIPLAIKIDTIEKPDNRHVLAVLEQAKENVKPFSTIDSLVLDRGFLDGKILYDIDLQGLEFVIPLKRNSVNQAPGRCTDANLRISTICIGSKRILQKAGRLSVSFFILEHFQFLSAITYGPSPLRSLVVLDHN